jgi:predicted metalloprotease with PDZ domain
MKKILNGFYLRYYVKVIVLLLPLFGYLSGWSQPGNKTAAYIVSFNKSNCKEISIEATLPLINDTLYMSQAMTEGLENGWAHYFSDLKATSRDGRGLELKSIGKSLWVVGGNNTNNTINLSYKVLINHDKYQWKVSGAFARAYTTDSLVFFAGRVVFIVPKGSSKYQFTVQYILPNEWDISTPYLPINDAQNKFMVTNLSSLWANGNMAGWLEKENIKHNGIEVEFASTKGTREGNKLMSQAISPIVEEYDRLMGGSPKGKFTIFTTVGHDNGGGEAFRNSISLKMGNHPSISNKSEWGYSLSHEIFHLWNGVGTGLFPAINSESEWFVEGFTEYMSLLIGQKKGLITEKEFFENLSIRLAKLKYADTSLSLIDAGKDKGKNYNLIYFGGMYLAMAIDIELINNSQGSLRFSDFLKSMYNHKDKFSNGYTYQDILEIADDFKIANIKSLIERYTSKPGVVPIENYLKVIGLIVVNGNSVPTLMRISGSTDEQSNYLKKFLN